MDKKHLTLADAQRLGRLGDFARQEEARGVGSTTRDNFDGVMQVYDFGRWVLVDWF